MIKPDLLESASPLWSGHGCHFPAICNKGDEQWNPGKRYGDDPVWAEITSNQFQLEIKTAMRVLNKMKADGKL